MDCSDSVFSLEEVLGQRLKGHRSASRLAADVSKGQGSPSYESEL